MWNMKQNATLIENVFFDWHKQSENLQYVHKENMGGREEAGHQTHLLPAFIVIEGVGANIEWK